MLKNYIKITFRNLIKYKIYSIVNIAGLAVGMACCILILLWVKDELSYDRFHEKAANIYRVMEERHLAAGEIVRSPLTPPPLAQALKADYPEIINSARLVKTREKLLFRYGKSKYLENEILFADPSIFDILTFPFIEGNPELAHSNPFSIIITKRISKKYFGDDNPIGKTLTIDNEYDLSIIGVLKDIPDNSHIKFDFVIPFDILKNLGWNFVSWDNNSNSTYLLLQKNIDFQIMNEKISRYLDKHIKDNHTGLYLQSLIRIHLYTDSDYLYIYIFSTIALFILIIACINFINLTAAHFSYRTREIGMRKVVGAQRIDIIKQFLGESVVLTLMAFILAIALVELFMPIFNNLSGKELTFEFFSNIYITFGIAGIIILTALLSGSYPALFLSSFKPVNILKGSNLDASSKSSFRKGLVMFQFTITVILFVGTISVYKQLNYMQNKELGYEKDCIIYMPLVGDLHEKYKLIKSELLRNPNILNATVSSQSMMGIEVSTTDVDWEGKNPEDKISMCVASVDYDYFDTFKMKIIQGRKFSKKISTDDSSAYIINEAAAKVMGMKSPIEKQFTLWSNEGYIIGVVKDYHFHSLQYVLEPLVIRIAPDYTYYLCAKIASDNIPKTIKFLETVWGKFVPEFPFEYHFLDQSLDKLYRNEQRLGVIFKYFSAVAIIISCLGLFGLSSFMTEQRTKEIGIRKVLGATVSGIVYLLTKEFTVLVLIANIIAWPVAYYAMSRWLRGFAYRINIELLTFVMAAALALVIALITVSYHALKAAYANPIEALRYE